MKKLFPILFFFTCINAFAQNPGDNDVVRQMGEDDVRRTEEAGNNTSSAAGAIGDAIGHFNTLMGLYSTAQDLYNSSRTLSNGECAPDFETSETAMMPTNCRRGTECGECFISATRELNFVRRQLGRLNCIYQNTKNFNESALAFGDNARGKIMYTGGHNIEKGTADAVSAMRAFFNFSFLSIYDKVVNFLVIGNINLVQLNTYSYRASLPTGISSSNYTFQWESTCGGSFSSPTDSATFFTAPAIGATCVDCTIYCTITDACGRQYYQEHEITICPTGSTLSVNLVNFTGSKSAADNLLQWTTSGENNSHHFDLEYSTDGILYSKIRLIVE